MPFLDRGPLLRVLLVAAIPWSSLACSDAPAKQSATSEAGADGPLADGSGTDAAIADSTAGDAAPGEDAGDAAPDPDAGEISDASGDSIPLPDGASDADAPSDTGITDATGDATDGSTVNLPPTASAGSDQNGVPRGSQVSLDGTGSSDPDGDPLSYQWTQTQGPSVILNDATLPAPSFVAPDLYATLEFRLVVNDGVSDSAPDTVSFTMANAPPLAAIVAQAVVQRNALVILDGSASSDPDGDALTYSWVQTAGAPIAMTDTSAVKPAFQAPSGISQMEFSLTVSDGVDSSIPATVTIVTFNDAPSANAGPDQTVFKATTIALDGTASSDPDADPLTYQWNQTGGTPVALSDVHSATPTLITPMAAGPLTFSLEVSDSALPAASPDVVTVTVLNREPVADAGPDQLNVARQAIVQLDGSLSSDPDGEPLIYAWKQVAGPLVTLSDASAEQPTFAAPDRSGKLIFSLTVSDGEAMAAEDLVIIEMVNSAPIASAGQDREVNGGEQVELDARDSVDTDADRLRYEWRQTGGTPVRIAMADQATAAFVAPASDDTLTFEVAVSDELSTDQQAVTIMSRGYGGQSARFQINPFATEVSGAGRASGLVVDDNYLYVAAGAALRTYDITDPVAPILLNTLSSSFISAIAVQGTRAYVGRSGELAVLDVTDPGSPSQLGSVAVPAPVALAVHGDTVIANCGTSGGLKLIDVSDPTAPAVLGTFAGSIFGRYLALTGDGNHLYFANDHDGLNVIDVGTDPTQPTLEAKIPARALGVTILGDLAIAVIEPSETRCEVRTYSIQAPNNPIPLGNVTFGCQGSISPMVSAGSTVYVGSPNAVVHAIDVSTPSNPVIVGQFSSRSQVACLAVTQDQSALFTSALLLGAAVERFDLVPGTWMPNGATKLSSPGLVHSSSAGHGVLALGTEAGLRVLDLADPHSPAEIGLLADGRVTEVDVDGDRAAYATNGVLHVADLTDPSSPNLLGTQQTDALSDLSLRGDFVFAAAVGSKFIVFDIRDPASIEETYRAAGNAGLVSVAIQDDRAYLFSTAYSTAGLGIYDIADPASPLSLLDSANSLNFNYISGGAIWDDHIFTYGIRELFRIANVADPSAPVALAPYTSYSRAAAMKIAGRYAYVATLASGLNVFDVGDPGAVHLVGHLGEVGANRTLTLFGAQAYVGTDQGLLIYDRTPVQLDPLYAAGSAGATLLYQVTSVGFPAGDKGVACKVTAGSCVVSDVDALQGTASVSWSLPDTPGSHEIAVAVGNQQHFFSMRDRVHVE